jgi:glutamyl-tRNA synthetase
VARKKHGEIFLRVDDLDQQRVRRDYLTDIFDVIDWLGLDYDDGPSGVEDFLKNYSQIRVKKDRYLGKTRKSHIY